MSETQKSNLRRGALPRDTLERLVLERQLALFSGPMMASVYGLPLWSLVVSWVMSGPFPSIGVAPLWKAATWFVIVCAASLTAGLLDRAYRRASENTATFDARVWMPRMIFIMTLLSLSWASVIWIFWIPGNQVNQITLIAVVICGVLNGMVARITRFDAFLFGSGASMLAMWLRCLSAPDEVAQIFNFLIPILFLALALSVRTASRNIRGHIAAQIENEYLKDENEQARFEAEQANRMKSAFLANMSHELRTPLNAILGFSEIIASQAFGPSASDRYREYANDIHDSGRHLLDMINSLLDVAKIEAGKLELNVDRIDAATVIEHASRLVAARAQEKGLSLRLNVSPLAANFMADERALRQIVINLLSNAVKFTEHGFIETRVEPADGAVVLSVTDTGCGIAPAQAGTVFEAFEQADNRYTKSNTGTGLGLTLVRALARLHGGDCTIDTEPGRGTTVSVTFPQPLGTFGAARDVVSDSAPAARLA